MTQQTWVTKEVCSLSMYERWHNDERTTAICRDAFIKVKRNFHHTTRFSWPVIVCVIHHLSSRCNVYDQIAPTRSRVIIIIIILRWWWPLRYLSTFTGQWGRDFRRSTHDCGALCSFMIIIRNREISWLPPTPSLIAMASSQNRNNINIMI